MSPISHSRSAATEATTLPLTFSTRVIRRGFPLIPRSRSERWLMSPISAFRLRVNVWLLLESPPGLYGFKRTLNSSRGSFLKAICALARTVLYVIGSYKGLDGQPRL